MSFPMTESSDCPETTSGERGAQAQARYHTLLRTAAGSSADQNSLVQDLSQQPDLLGSLLELAVLFAGPASARAWCEHHQLRAGWRDFVPLHRQEYVAVLRGDPRFDLKIDEALRSSNWAPDQLAGLGGERWADAARRLLTDLSEIALEAGRLAEWIALMRGRIGSGLHALQVQALMRASLAVESFDGLKVLEVGPREGHLLRELQRAGAEVQGVDLEPLIPEVSRGDFMTVGLGGSFDLLIATSVFEVGSEMSKTDASALSRSPALLRRIRDVLSPGGVVVLENLGFPIPFSATQAKAAGFEVLPHPVPSVNHIHGGRGCTLRKIGGALALVVAILAGTPALARTLTLTEAETTALAHNAELAGVESQLAQAKARLGGASLLLQENPELVAGAGQRSGGLNSSLDLELGVQQRFELFGQRGARIDTAQASVNAAQASLDAERLNLLAKIRSAFGRLLARQRAATVAEESLRLGGDALGAARARLSAGESNRLELNAAIVERGQAVRALSRARTELAQAAAELRLLLGVTDAEPLSVEGELPSVGPPPPPLPSLVQTALSRRPELRAATAELAAAQSQRVLAGKEALPNPALGVAYRREGAEHIVAGTLSIPIPLFNRNQTGKGVASAAAAQAQSLLSATEARIRAEVELAYRRYQEAASAASVYGQEVRGAVDQNLALGTDAYRSGKIDFLQLLLIRRSAIDAENAAIDSLEELSTAQAELDRAIGLADPTNPHAAPSKP